MNMLIILLTIFEVLVCLLLIGVILLQRNKGSGAGVSFGGGAAEAVFGAQMGNVLTKSTVILAIVFLANTLVLSILVARRGGAGDDSLMGNEIPRPAAPAASPATPATTPDSLPDAPPANAASALDDVPRSEAPAAAPAATPAATPAAPAPEPAAPPAAPDAK